MLAAEGGEEEMRGYCFETEVHAELREQARRFAADEIAPHAHEWEEAEEFPRELYKRFAEAGLLGLGFPEELGGSGGDFGHAFVASEEMVLAGKSVGTCVGLGIHAIALPPIVELGSEDQKRRFVAPVLAGDAIAALGITEPGTGSDVAAIRTRAVRDGDHYVINGQKVWTSLAHASNWYFLLVRTSSDGHKVAGLSVEDVQENLDRIRDSVVLASAYLDLS